MALVITDHTRYVFDLHKIFFRFNFVSILESQFMSEISQSRQTEDSGRKYF